MSKHKRLQICTTCDVERFENDFSATSTQCRLCLTAKERERCSKKTPSQHIYSRLLHMRCKFKLGGFIEYEDFDVFWKKCDGLSAISGRRATSVVFIDAEKPVSVRNIAFVTKHEKITITSLRKKNKPIFHGDILAKLEALHNSEPKKVDSI